MKEWKPTLLGKIGKDIRNTYKPNKEISLPYIGYEHIDQQTLLLLGFGKSNETQSDKKKFISGDIIFGTLRPYFRKVIIPKFDGVCSSDLAIIRANDGYDQKFLFYILASQPLIDYADVSSNGTKMPRAKWNVLGKTEWLIPNLPTQQRIASILSAYDDLIEVNNQRIKLLEETARELYKEWFVRMRFPGYKQAKFVKGVPEGWEEKKIGEVIELAYGKALKEEDRKEGEFLVYGSSGIVGTHTSCIAKAPGIVVGRKGNVGSVFWVTKDFYPIDTAFFVKTTLSLYYCYFNLKLQHFIEGDAAVPGLSRNQAYSLFMLIPTNHLLKKFDVSIQPIFEMASNLEDQNIQLRQIRDRLLPRLISGKLEVKTNTTLETGK